MPVRRHSVAVPTSRAATLPLLFVLLAAACSDPAGPSIPSRQETGTQLAGGARHVIVMRQGAPRAALLARISQLGGTVERVHDSIDVLAVRGLTANAVRTLSASTDVEGISSDVRVHWLPPMSHARRVTLATAPLAKSDPTQAAFYPIQWNMRLIRANDAWKATNQGKNSLVCILDSGIDPGHIDLAGKVDLSISKSVVSTESDVLDHNLHGTFVSALVASNGIGMASVAPGARLCAVKVIDASGSGSFDDLITGIVYASQTGAQTINMSLGATFGRDEPGLRELIKALQRAINFALRHGVLPVASAGNGAINFTHVHDSIVLPASLLGVISVGATAPVNQQHFNQIASYSDRGFPQVNVFAPGGDFVEGSVQEDLILSACSRFTTAFDCSDGQSYLLGAGTSFAAPHVTGEAAVMDAEHKGKDLPPLTEVCIFLGADEITGRRIDPLYGWGRIDVIGGLKCQKRF